MTEQTPDKTPREMSDGERTRALRLAKLFDLRSFIGTFFLISGVIVTLEGATATDAEIAKASDLNVSLWSGLAMLLLGLVFIGWMIAQPPELPDQSGRDHSVPPG